LLTTASIGSFELSFSTSVAGTCAVENQYTGLEEIRQFSAARIVDSLLDIDAVVETRLIARGGVRPRRREPPCLSKVALDEETTAMVTLNDFFLYLAKVQIR